MEAKKHPFFELKMRSGGSRLMVDEEFIKQYPFTEDEVFKPTIESWANKRGIEWTDAERNCMKLMTSEDETNQTLGETLANNLRAEVWDCAWCIRMGNHRHPDMLIAMWYAILAKGNKK